MSVKYKLWVHTDILGIWLNADDAREGARSYIEAHPDEVGLLHFGAFRTGHDDQPAKSVFTVSGQELVDYLDDVTNSGDNEDEWDG